VSAHEQDRALAAVRRVRAARENDSKLGLQRLLIASRLRAAEVDRAAERLAGVPGFESGSPADLTDHVVRTAWLASSLRDAEYCAEVSREVAGEANRRWQMDRVQVRVVDILLERRAQARAEERARRETRELDDLAAQAWLRRRGDTVEEVAG
jgi:hypothetical protein